VLLLVNEQRPLEEASQQKHTYLPRDFEYELKLNRFITAAHHRAW